MSTEHERKIRDWTIRIDRTLCVGFGDCMDVAPDVFEFDHEGICAFRADAAEIEPDRLVQACDICPVDALTLLNGDGEQVVP
jgi:ferredoxin